MESIIITPSSLAVVYICNRWTGEEDWNAGLERLLEVLDWSTEVLDWRHARARDRARARTMVSGTLTAAITACYSLE